MKPLFIDRRYKGIIRMSKISMDPVDSDKTLHRGRLGFFIGREMSPPFLFMPCHFVECSCVFLLGA